MNRALQTIVLIAALGAASGAPAQSDNSLRVRGTVAALDANILTIRTTSNQMAEVKLNPDYSTILYTPIKLEDVKPNAYIAAASAPQPDGSLRALALVVFPEAMRGLNEGTKIWDLGPSSRMTNATVAQLIDQSGANELTVRFDGDKEQKIVVPEGTPLATFASADKSAIAVGTKAVVFATRGPDGSLSAGLVGIGKDGFSPPV